MEINVSQQLKAPIGYTREYEVDEPMDVLGINVSTRVRGSVKLIRTNRGILVQGTVHANIPVECSRCLKVFDYSLNIKIEEEYFPVIDVNSGTPLEIPEDAGSFMIDEHHILDLSEAIRQNALLAIPMKPLCREACAGLCQSCGKDLNKGQCDCKQTEIDPRWLKLVKIASAGKKTNKRKKETE
jgi:uncharacterized protein